VCAVHQNHDYDYHPQGVAGVWNDSEARRNKELARVGVEPRTIEDAQYRLSGNGEIGTNGMYWLAPARRAAREVSRQWLEWWRTYVWHPALNATRPVRAVFGLRRSAVPKVLQSKKRVHWMD